MLDRSFDELSAKERQELAELAELATRMRDSGDVEAARTIRLARLRLARAMMFPERPLMDEIEDFLD